MGMEELFHSRVSQGLNVQLRAFVCLTASDELMNGLFNKPSPHVKGKEQKKKSPLMQTAACYSNDLGCVSTKVGRIQLNCARSVAATETGSLLPRAPDPRPGPSPGGGGGTSIVYGRRRRIGDQAAARAGARATLAKHQRFTEG